MRTNRDGHEAPTSPRPVSGDGSLNLHDDLKVFGRPTAHMQRGCASKLARGELESVKISCATASGTTDCSQKNIHVVGASALSICLKASRVILQRTPNFSPEVALFWSRTIAFDRDWLIISVSERRSCTQFSVSLHTDSLARRFLERCWGRACHRRISGSTAGRASDGPMLTRNHADHAYARSPIPDTISSTLTALANWRSLRRRKMAMPHQVPNTAPGT